MRCVTRKPPAMLIVASRMAAAPSIAISDAEAAADLQHAADDDDAADRVGDAHQRRVQRRRDVPDHLPADEAGEHEHGEVRQELGRRDPAEAGEQRRRATSAASRLRGARRRRRSAMAVTSGGLDEPSALAPASAARGGGAGPSWAAATSARRRGSTQGAAHDLVVLVDARSASPRPCRRAGARGCCRRAGSPWAPSGSAGRCSR